jgi:shikimate kinase
MVVTLIGFRGAGKSSVAPRLAARLGWDWIDADAELTRRLGRSIPEIFTREGEAAFRRYEADLLAELFAQDRLVIAAGGGAILNLETRRRARAAGPVVWLRASIATIWARIGPDLGAGGGRPALTLLDPRAEVEALAAQREPVYAEAASVVIDTDDRSVDEIVEAIVDQLALPPEPTA